MRVTVFHHQLDLTDCLSANQIKFAFGAARSYQRKFYDAVAGAETSLERNGDHYLMKTNGTKDNFSVGRRQFFNQAAAGTLGAIASPKALAASSPTSPASQQRKSSYTKFDSMDLLAGNERMEVSFDLRSGALKQILHKSLQHTLKIPEFTAAPVRIWLGNSGQPDQTTALISQTAQHLTLYRLFSYPQGIAVEFVWENLKDIYGKETGIAVHQFCTLEDGSEFLRLRTRVVNRGDFMITGLFLGLQGLGLGADGSAEIHSSCRQHGGEVVQPPSAFDELTPDIFHPSYGSQISGLRVDRS